MSAPARRRRSGALQLTLVAPLLALVACGGEANEPTGGATLGAVEAVASPAGPGGGEPRLEPDGRGGLILSWLEPIDEARWALRFDRISADGRWRGARTVVERDDLFVNWADVPIVSPGSGSALVALWLQRGGSGGYDYGVRFARSDDDGVTWGDPGWLHEDRSPTEHGFVSTVRPEGGGVGAVWLDGRRFVASDDAPATEKMTLRARWLEPVRDGGSGARTQEDLRQGPGGTVAAPAPEVGSVAPAPGVGAETLLDGRVCDCCPTGAASVPGGALVVYRNRSEGEVRDIHRVRLADGVWSDPAPVHEDGWRIEACPVNGPAVAADGPRAAVAWFTAASDDPRVLVAFSEDGGGSFAPPSRVDVGNPVGRADVVLLDDGSAVVSWIERRGEAGAELMARRVDASGSMRDPSVVAPSSGERASGFPRMERLADGLLFAWTDDAGDERRIRVARASLGGTVDPTTARAPTDTTDTNE